MPHVAQGMLTLSGVHDCTHSLYMHYILLNLSVFGQRLRINDSGLFAWISLTALSRTYFIIFMDAHGSGSNNYMVSQNLTKQKYNSQIVCWVTLCLMYIQGRSNHLF